MAQTVDIALLVTADKRSISEAKSALASVTAEAKNQLAQLSKAGSVDSRALQVAAKNVDELNAKLQVTTIQLNEAKSGLEGLEGTELDKQRAKVAALEKQYASAVQKIEQIPASLQKVVQKQEEVNKKAQEAARKQEEINKKAQEYDNYNSQTRRSVSAFGDVDSALATGASLASGLGAGGVGQALSLPADVFAVAEQLPLLKDGFKGVATSLTAMPGILGTVATAGAGLAGSFGAVAFVLGPIIAIAAGASLALGAFNKEQEKTRKEAEKAAAAVKAQAEVYADITQALDAGDQTSAVDTYLNTLEKVDNLQRQIAYQQEQVAQAELARQAEQRDRGEVGRFIKDIFQDTGLEATLGELKEGLTELEDELAKTDGVLAIASQELEAAGIDVSTVTRDQAQAEEDLAQKRADAQKTINDLNTQEQTLIAKRRQALEDLRVDRGVRDSREQVDYSEQVAESRKRLEKIEADGRKRIEEIAAESVKSEKAIREKAASAESKQIKDAQKRIEQVNADFNKASISSRLKYLADIARIDRTSQQAQFEAIINNDIFAAELAERQAEAQREERDASFADEQAQLVAQRDERIAALQEENRVRLDEIRASAAAEIDALRETTRERIDSEKAAVAERIKEEREAQAEAERERQKRLERQAEDDKLADERAERAFKEELQRIDEKRRAEENALNQVGNAANALVQSVGNATSAAINAVGQATSAAINNLQQQVNASSRGGRTASASTRSYSPYRFAEGGVVPAGKEVLGRFEGTRNYDEMVFPLTQNNISRLAQGIASASGGGQSILYDFSGATFGGGVTPEDVRMAILSAHQAAYRGQGRAISGAR